MLHTRAAGSDVVLRGNTHRPLATPKRWPSWNRGAVSKCSQPLWNACEVAGTGRGKCLSASSRRTILCRPGGRVTFFCANILIRFLTTSMPRSSDAFSSSTASFMSAGPSRPRAMARMLVVLPVPGGPARIRLGMLPCSEMIFRRDTASSLPTISATRAGRYFSSCRQVGGDWRNHGGRPCLSSHAELRKSSGDQMRCTKAKSTPMAVQTEMTFPALPACQHPWAPSSWCPGPDPASNQASRQLARFRTHRLQANQQYCCVTERKSAPLRAWLSRTIRSDYTHTAQGAGRPVQSTGTVRKCRADFLRRPTQHAG